MLKFSIPTRLLEVHEVHDFRTMQQKGEVEHTKTHGFYDLVHSAGIAYLKIRDTPIGVYLEYYIDTGPHVYRVGRGGYIPEMHENPIQEFPITSMDPDKINAQLEDGQHALGTVVD